MRSFYFKNIMFFLLFLFTHQVQAFSFNLGDNDYYYPRYAPVYHPWYATPAAYYRPPAYAYPQMNNYDSSTMVRKRQQVMSRHDDAMTRLYDMLYGNSHFNRAEAIQLTRKIEVTSGSALTKNFHPAAVVDFHSRTAPSLWGNEQTFKSHAQALQAAAKDLAEELTKTPAAGEAAVELPEQNARFEHNAQPGVRLSPGVWEKYNTLFQTCEGCHGQFRGHRW